MTKWKIYNEDAVGWAKNYEKGRFHALLTDAPYHLTSITKRFGKNGSAPAKFGDDGVFQRASKGFMGTQWDGGDVAFRPETWEAFGQVLYPGAFGMAFSASRNWHRMAVAIEDAGFIIHPTMFFLWINGQGFPKATRVKGHEEFDGHRYGLQALKPSVEPIIVFQKPYDGKPVENITSTGAGALNIDGGRIALASGDEYTINEFEDGMKPWGNGAGHKYKSKKVEILSNHSRSANSAKSKGIYGDSKAQETHQTSGQLIGRWPSNLIIDTESAERLDAQTGNLGHAPQSNGNAPVGEISRGVTPLRRGNLVVRNDSGGASRFFYQVSTQLDEADPFLYCAKVSPKERNAGLDDLPNLERSFMNTHNGNPEDGETWHPIDDRTGELRDRFKSISRNPHPTLKPIDLCKYLATLLLPPNEYAPRRIFVPFSGSGSEMIGAGLAGWEHVVGVEFDKENGYVDVAMKRLEHWLK